MCLWIRIYIHYIGQHLYLKGIVMVPVYTFQVRGTLTALSHTHCPSTPSSWTSSHPPPPFTHSNCTIIQLDIFSVLMKYDATVLPADRELMVVLMGPLFNLLVFGLCVAVAVGLKVTGTLTTL